MKLHESKESMELLISNISERTGVREDVLEKDYYVTLLLKELSEKNNQNYAYFNGGTALYKALKSIRRFRFNCIGRWFAKFKSRTKEA